MSINQKSLPPEAGQTRSAIVVWCPERNADHHGLIWLLVVLIQIYNMDRTMVDGKNRADVKPGCKVEIVLKKDQRTGILTSGRVKDILTKSATHPHGIKVRLESGEVGRVKNICSED